MKPIKLIKMRIKRETKLRGIIILILISLFIFVGVEQIKLTDRGNYIWIASPWNNGKEPLFHPPVN